MMNSSDKMLRVGAACVGAALAYAAAEGLTVADSLYWFVQTSTTIGFGDMAPMTNAGRLVAAAVALLFSGIIANAMAEWHQRAFRPATTVGQRFSNRLDGERVALFGVGLGAALTMLAVVEGWTATETGYFFVMATTTVGYGDVAPRTVVGRILASAIALTCIVPVGIACAAATRRLGLS